ncbi:cyclase family protein [Couchioplanes caeruleus]|uniref:Cyclase n=1 Tax=Couchioplanes caeruleus subsp. caeruleus TaxID=56427 RepID=A0A1K0FMS6_9ACTN|nr:cyclase family protein [Couchioplanes caeruleus]OJF14097.1 cyclase [Couchioplanes caeruleus subsp. caeruleus]
MRLDLVNLSHVADPATTCLYPGDPAFELEIVATIAEDGFRLHRLRQGEHTGTHWSAPGHFTDGAALADDLDVQDLCRPAVKIDVRERCAADPDYALSQADLLAWERAHGPIPPESIVVLWTGWDAKWGTDAYYGYDRDGVMHQPGFGVDAVRWLIGTGRLGRRGGTGTDTFGPDPGADPTYAVSRLVHREHRLSVEVLANLAALPATGASLLCGGQIVRGGAGSPALIYGVLPPG